MSTPVTRDQVREAVADRVTIVEALPAPYFEDGHLPGAVNLPHDSDEAPRSPPCSPSPTGPSSSTARTGRARTRAILGRRLDQLGYADVRVYEAGKQDWLEAGLPVESASPVVG